MPCRDDYSDNISEKLETRLQAATKVACELAEHIDKNSKVQLLSIMSLSTDTKKWVIEHREIDRKRLEAEAYKASRDAMKAQALSKLTPEERRILGI